MPRKFRRHNGPFESSDATRNTGMPAQVNVVAVTELTRFLSFPTWWRGGAAGSCWWRRAAAFQPGPQMAVYCASKAYVLSFGEARRFSSCPRQRGHRDHPVPWRNCHRVREDGGCRSSAALFRGSMVMSAADVARIGYRGLKAGRRVASWRLRVSSTTSWRDRAGCRRAE